MSSTIFTEDDGHSSSSAASSSAVAADEKQSWENQHDSDVDIQHSSITSLNDWSHNDSNSGTSSSNSTSVTNSSSSQHTADSDAGNTSQSTDTSTTSTASTTQQSSGDPQLDWWESHNATTTNVDHSASTLQQINNEIADNSSDWPQNDNGQYLIIDVTIHPQADIDLTTIFNLTADAQGASDVVNYDSLVAQLAKISESTYIEIDYYWGAKPDLIVSVEPDFNIDSDVFTSVNHDVDDVILNTLLDIGQTATPTSSANVSVDLDPNDTNHDGHLFDVGVDTSLDVFVDQWLHALIDATSPG